VKKEGPNFDLSFAVGMVAAREQMGSDRLENFAMVPSEADIKVTRDLTRAGQLLKIEVLDHVILGRATQERPQDYLSLRALGYFYT
jgi:predicted ATPase with chaperone activity